MYCILVRVSLCVKLFSLQLIEATILKNKTDTEIILKFQLWRGENCTPCQK